MLDDAKQSTWRQHAPDFTGQQCSRAPMNMVIDAYGSYKIDRAIAKRQFNGRQLLMHAEGSNGGEHADRRIAPDRLREVAAGQFQQLAATAADIQPFQSPRIRTSTPQQPLNQKPFPTVEMERITRESIPDRIIEQLGIRRRILIKFDVIFVIARHSLSFAL